jgi:F-type H+-transporting ATPase subunit delta
MASVTNIYARAFADVIFDQKLDPGKTLQEAQSLVQLVASSKELREVWEAPSIPAVQKRGLLDAIVDREQVSRPLRNFMAVLIDHGRVGFLGPIVTQLERELNQRLGFAEAEIVSARELDEGERSALEAQVAKTTGKKVRARYTQDQSLLGGAVVKIGSTIYDGSVKGQLERIREQLVGSGN